MKEPNKKKKKILAAKKINARTGDLLVQNEWAVKGEWVSMGGRKSLKSGWSTSIPSKPGRVGQAQGKEEGKRRESHHFWIEHLSY